MLGWLTGKKDQLKVFVATNVIEVDSIGGELTLMPNADLREWLVPYRGQYRFGYDSRNGKRWIEFDDKNVAIMCRLVFA